jgi:hypothetical protein
LELLNLKQGWLITIIVIIIMGAGKAIEATTSYRSQWAGLLDSPSLPICDFYIDTFVSIIDKWFNTAYRTQEMPVRGLLVSYLPKRWVHNMAYRPTRFPWTINGREANPCP